MRDRRCGRQTKGGAPCQLPTLIGGDTCQLHNESPASCGRRTRAGSSCQRGVARIRSWSGSDYYVSPACVIHLTVDERQAYEAAVSEQGDALHLAHNSPPACHGWAVPNVDLGEAVGLRRARLLLEAMSQWRAGRCAICGRSDGDIEDHCHRTGLFRGYLCQQCNIQEGIWNTTIFRLYRERPPAVIVGYTYQYMGFGYSDGAPAQQWVVDRLGPVPRDYTPEAVTYLAAAARLVNLTVTNQKLDNPLRRMGF